MKKVFYLVAIVISMAFLSSCATIIGGSKYYAHVKVPDHPQAKISYKGTYQGTGEAIVKVKRKEANKLSFAVKEEGCDEQIFNFRQRELRVAAFILTLEGWTIGFYYALPIPAGIGVDFLTGAIWKPDINEKGITKIDYRNYIYNIDYKNCKK